MSIHPCSVISKHLPRATLFAPFRPRFALFLLLALFCNFSAVAQNASVESDAALYTAQIEAIESEFGPFDSRLLEPLAGLAELQFERGDFEASASSLRRQLQITRNTFGFEDPRLLPLVDALVRTEIARSNWQQVADYLDLRSQIYIGSFDEMRLAEEMGDVLSPKDNSARMALANALALQSGWLVQQVALTPTREAIDSFFDAREIDDRLFDLSEEVVNRLESLSGYGDPAAEYLLLTQWLPLMYRQSYNDFALVQLLNARSGFSYDTIDHLVRREGGALNKLSSPGLSARSVSGPMSRVPLLERGDPIGVGYLRDGYFGIRAMDARLTEFLERQIAAGASNNEVALTRQALAASKIYRGDYQLLQNRGSGIREYREAHELLLASGLTEDEVDDYFAQPALIPSAQLRLTFEELKADNPNGECLPTFTALSDRLATLAAPDVESSAWNIELPHAEITARFDVSRRGKATGVKIDDAGAEDARLRRAVNRAMKDFQFRPAVVKGRTQRLRDQCMRVRVPTLD